MYNFKHNFLNYAQQGPLITKQNLMQLLKSYADRRLQMVEETAICVISNYIFSTVVSRITCIMCCS